MLFKTIILLTLIATSFTLIYRQNYRFKNILKSPICILLFMELFIFSITDLFSNTPLIAIFGTYSRGFGLIIDLFLLIFTIYCSLTLSEERIAKVLKIVFFSGLIVATYALLQKIGIDPFFSNYDTNIFAGRVFSLLGNPSYLGQYMLLTIITGIYFVLYGSTKKMFFSIGTLLMITTLLLSETRSSILSLIVILILFILKFSKYVIPFIRNHKIILLLVLAVVMSALLILPKDRFSISEDSFRSFKSRIEIWNGTVDLIKQKPILGYGEETFYIYFPEIITKKFLTLEENAGISADRVHNETLQTFFDHGLFGVLAYLALLFFILRIFFKTKNKLMLLLSTIVIANAIQNQFGFPDITINILIAFCLGGIITLEIKSKSFTFFKISKWVRVTISIIIISFSVFTGIETIYLPYLSQMAFANSQQNYSIDYIAAVEANKKAISYTPYYSELWYDLMFINQDSMEKALVMLEKIEGNSGNVLAWKGNFYSHSDPQKASEFYIRALEKNPFNPDWIRAFADMLYANKNYEDALYLYNQYLNAVPDFWKWSEDLKSHSTKEQNSYKTFFKTTPNFTVTVNRINEILSILKDKK